MFLSGAASTTSQLVARTSQAIGEMQSQRDRSVNRRSFLQMSGVASGGFLLLESPQRTDAGRGVAARRPDARTWRAQARAARVPGIDPARAGAAGRPARHHSRSHRIVRHFIEDYHERLEEDYLFPRFEKGAQADRSHGRSARAAPGRPAPDRSDRAADDGISEHQLFGQDGFAKEVDRVSAIEQRLGIYDLAQFTPRT